MMEILQMEMAAKDDEAIVIDLECLLIIKIY